MYLWNFIYAGIVLLLEPAGFTIGSGITLSKLFVMPITNGHQFVYNMGGWFIVPLFMVECLNVLLRKCMGFMKDSHQKKIFVFIIYFLLGIMGIWLASSGRNTGWWLVLVRMLYFLPFYGLGIFYKRILEKFDRASNLLYFSVIFILELAIIICQFGHRPSYSQAWCNDFNDGLILPFVVGTLGIAFWLRVAKLLEPVIGRSRINLIADNSYSIMINQFMGFMAVKAVYALIHNFTSCFADFDLQRYKTDIWYFYLPREISQTKIIYLVSGICFPIALRYIIRHIKNLFTKKGLLQK